jgi:cell division protease FtsH
MTLGGRAAEELVFNEVTTGASNDIEKVTATSKAMVMKYGMSEKLGPRALGGDQTNPFLGRSFGAEADYSQEIAREIDDEIRRIIEDAHLRAREVLTEHMEQLHRLSKILLDRETIDRAQFLKLLDGVPEHEVWPPEAEKPAEEPTSDRAIGRPRLPGFQLPAPPDAPPASA